MATDTREKLENYINNAVNEGRYSVREREEDGEWVLTVGDLPQDVFMLNVLKLSDTNISLNEWLSQKTPNEFKRDFADIYQYELGDDLEYAVDEAYKQQFTFFNNFAYENKTNDYGTAFHFTFIVGIDQTKEISDPERTVYADMSGYVKDYDYSESGKDYSAVVYRDDVEKDTDETYLLDERIENLEQDLEKVISKFIDSLNDELEGEPKARLNAVKGNLGYNYGIVPEARDLILDAISSELEGTLDFSIKNGVTFTIKKDAIPKCYALNAKREETFYPLPADVVEKLEKLTEKAVKQTECEKLRHELYDCYVDDFSEGREIDSELRCYDDWLAVAYPDEGYFVGHVDADMAKFLCENDPLINLDYYELYEESVRTLFEISKDDLECREDDIDDGFLHFDYETSGDFWDNGDIDKLVARSVRPDLLNEICSEENIEAKTFTELFEKSGDISSYVGFEADLTGKEPKVTAYVDFSTRNAVHSLGQIPLSARESAFVLKACDEVYKQDTGKSLLGKLKEDKTVER